MADYEKLMNSLFEEKSRWKEELEKKVLEKEAKKQKLNQDELAYKLKMTKQEAIKNTKTSKDYNPRVDDKNLRNLQKEAKGLSVAASRHQQKNEIENRKSYNMKQNVAKGLLMTGGAALGIAGAKAIGRSIQKRKEEKKINEQKQQIQNKINELYQQLKVARLPAEKKQILAQIKLLSARLNPPAQQVNESTATDRYYDKKIEQAKKDGTLEKLLKKDKAAANRYNQMEVTNSYNRDSKYMNNPRSREDRLKNDRKKARAYKDNILPELGKSELKKRQFHNFIPFSKKRTTSNLKEALKNPDAFKEPYEGKTPISNARRRFITKQQNKVEKQEKIERKNAEKKGREFVPSLQLRGEEKKIEKALRSDSTLAPKNSSNKEIKQFENERQYKRRISPYAKAEETDRLVKQNAKAELLKRLSENNKNKKKSTVSTKNRTKEILGAALATGAVATAGTLLKQHYDNKKKKGQEEANLRAEVENIPSNFLMAEYNRAIEDGNITKANMIKERIKN